MVSSTPPSSAGTVSREIGVDAKRENIVTEYSAMSRDAVCVVSASTPSTAASITASENSGDLAN